MMHFFKLRTYGFFVCLILEVAKKIFIFIPYPKAASSDENVHFISFHLKNLLRSKEADTFSISIIVFQ